MSLFVGLFYLSTKLLNNSYSKYNNIILSFIILILTTTILIIFLVIFHIEVYNYINSPHRPTFILIKGGGIRNFS